MTRLFAALRTAVYAAAFVFLWGWLALLVRDRFERGALAASWRAVGVTLMLVGAAIVLWCLVSFVVIGRGTPAPFDAPRRLVPAGPYRWVRNPMYLGALAVLAGFGFWHRSLAMVLFVIPVALAFHLFVLLYEEPTLTHRFGNEYEAYKTRVRRWLPAAPRNVS